MREILNIGTSKRRLVKKTLYIITTPLRGGGVKIVNYNFGLLPPVFLSMWISNQLSTYIIVK